MILLTIARLWLFVREVGGNNLGRWVHTFQQFTGGKNGDSWCCDFVCFVMSIFYEGRSRFTITGSCDILLASCRTLGKLTLDPQPGDLAFAMHGTDAYHVMFYTGRNATHFGSIEGNSNEDGSADGIGVFERSPEHPKARVFDHSKYLFASTA